MRCENGPVSSKMEEHMPVTVAYQQCTLSHILQWYKWTLFLLHFLQEVYSYVMRREITAPCLITPVVQVATVYTYEFFYVKVATVFTGIFIK